AAEPTAPAEDGDGDGLCGYSEFLDSGQHLFQQLDEDSDGWLSPKELQ
ncbi:MAG: transaldolase, partial [Calothrix sp. SM1_5_4]|nr:transaldolase [Calothrix sp. SM1_5_4]